METATRPRPLDWSLTRPRAYHPDVHSEPSISPRSPACRLEDRPMEQRLNYVKLAQPAFKAAVQLEGYLAQCSVDPKLLHMVKLRASQVNGCAYCLDMHWKDAKAAGETDQRLYGLSAWREAPYYTDRERAALEWIEAVTDVKDGHVSDEVFAHVRGQFNEQEVADLTWACAAINMWNRMAIAMRAPAGTYRPAGGGH
jgi:AhpD family alkylhydroperoxidase